MGLTFQILPFKGRVVILLNCYQKAKLSDFALIYILKTFNESENAYECDRYPSIKHSIPR